MTARGLVALVVIWLALFGLVALVFPPDADARTSSCCRTSVAHDGHSYRHPITSRYRT